MEKYPIGYKKILSKQQNKMLENKKTLLVIILLLFGLSVNAQKTDTLIHINGNIMTGELKKLQYGVLTWKMDGMGTIEVEIPKINTLKSAKRFDVRLQDGSRYYCSFGAGEESHTLYILLTTEQKKVQVDDIAQIFPLKKNFWLRTSGDIGFGGNYSKGSNLLTISLSSNLNHRRESTNIEFAWNTYYTFQGDSLSSTKSDARLTWERLRRSKLSYGANLGMGQNSELGTKVRLDFTLVGIYDILYNSWTRLSGFMGASIEREIPYGDAEPVENLTGLVALGWKVYKLTSPKVWVEAEARYIPYFTSNNRYRLNFNLKPKVGMLGNNLKVGFNTYYLYDSRPTSEEAHKEDWGASLEFSYSFH